MIAWRDGKIVDAESALAATDRGWLVGDAAFETILVVGGAPAFLGDHLARLNRGLETLRAPRRIGPEEARRALTDLVEAGAPSRRSAFRLTVSRVGGKRGLAPSADAAAQTTAFLSPVDAGAGRWTAIVARQRRWTGAAAIGFKSPGGYLDNMAARLEAADAGANEAIMLNEHGRVASASAANLFLVDGERLMTPPIAEGAMPGVVRGVVLDEAKRLGIMAVEAPLERADLATGALLLTNSLAGVVRTALVGAGAAAPCDVADRIVAAYERRLAEDLAGKGRAA
jgi:branched-chain amino acid aminotransferase